jgi:hypothetical protein
MAEAWLRRGIDPDAPDDMHLVVAVDPNGSPGERAVVELATRAAEGDGALFVAPADGWVQRRLDGDTLTVELYRGGTDPERLVRVETTVDPLDYAETGPSTLVFAAARGATSDEVVAAIQAEVDWPIVYAPRP